jgi:hypothetical protein
MCIFSSPNQLIIKIKADDIIRSSPECVLAGVVADLVPLHKLVVGTSCNMVLLDRVCMMMSEVFLLVQHQGPTF